MVRNFFFLVVAKVRGKNRHGKIFKNSSETVSVFSLGSLLDFLKSDMGSRLLLPKLIDFSAQVNFTRNMLLIRTAHSPSQLCKRHRVTVSIAEPERGTRSTNLTDQRESPARFFWYW